MSERPSFSFGPPWRALGIGWIIAVLVLLVVALSFFVPINAPNLDRWLILGLALALVLG